MDTALAWRIRRWKQTHQRQTWMRHLHIEGQSPPDTHAWYSMRKRKWLGGGGHGVMVYLMALIVRIGNKLMNNFQ